jgi:hypothetical protein
MIDRGQRREGTAMADLHGACGKAIYDAVTA